MQVRWVLSQFYNDVDTGQLFPVAAAYGANVRYPEFPATSGASKLVLLQCDSHQLAAAAQDNRLVVCPTLWAMTTLPTAVTDAYSNVSGVTSGMTLNSLLNVLSAIEPLYGLDWNPK